MKGNNIMKNAGKATLPKGEKLSDKLEKNKVSHGNNLNQNSKNSDKKGKNEKEEVDTKVGKKPQGTTSTGLPDTQGMATEAARTALKVAAARVPYTAWIPQGIRDKIIDKFMDSKLGQKLVEQELKRVRMSLILAGIGLVCGLLLTLFIIAGVATLIMSPISLVSEILDGIKDGVTSVWNFLMGYGFCSSEEDCSADAKNTYYNKLNTITDDYYDRCSIKMNGELLTATIFYDRMVVKREEDMQDKETDEEDEKKQFDSAADPYYHYSQLDINELDELDDVYRNRSASATCPLSSIETIDEIIGDIKSDHYTAEDIDNLLLSYGDKLHLMSGAEIANYFEHPEDVDIWDSIVSEVKGVGACLEYSFLFIKDSLGFDEYQCKFNRDNYKSYLINHYIPKHYAYLTGSKYNMTYEEIADEILILGEVNNSNANITTDIGSTDGLFTMLPANLNLSVTSNPASCRCHPVNNVWNAHFGVDIGGAPYGTEVAAFDDGTVAAITIATQKSCGSSVIKLKHTTDSGEVYYTRYVHLNRASNNILFNLKVGDNVRKGQVIGYVGGITSEDSCSTGPHLHFEVHDSDDKVINALVALKNVNEGRNILANKEIISACSAKGASC